MSLDKDIKKLSFENALEELEAIVKRIDSGEEDLAAAVNSFHRGTILKQHCEKMLSDAKLKIEKITKSDDKITKSEIEF